MPFIQRFYSRMGGGRKLKGNSLPGKMELLSVVMGWGGDGGGNGGGGGCVTAICIVE